mgnify:CR=1
MIFEYIITALVILCTIYVLIKIFPFLLKSSIWIIGFMGILTLIIFLIFYLSAP